MSERSALADIWGYAMAGICRRTGNICIRDIIEPPACIDRRRAAINTEEDAVKA